MAYGMSVILTGLLYTLSAHMGTVEPKTVHVKINIASSLLLLFITKIMTSGGEALLLIRVKK